MRNNLSPCVVIGAVIILIYPGEASAEGMWLFSMFQKGGFVMWPLLFCSIIALGIGLELLWRFRYDRVINKDFLSYLTTLSEKGDFAQATKLCKSHSELSLSRVVAAGLQRARYGLLEMERAIEAVGAHEAFALQRNLRGLGVLANLTPMLGLLGTVIGMIKAFNVISVAGTGNPGLVASGIAEALITTAAGLIVGIPTLAAYHFLRGRSERLVNEMEEISLRVVEDMQHAVAQRDNEADRE